MKYAVSYEGYMRPSGAEIVECKTDIEALIQIEDEYGYGRFSGEIEEGRTLDSITLQEIKEYLDCNNGDGSDLIVSIINLSTQEIIFQMG